MVRLYSEVPVSVDLGNQGPDELRADLLHMTAIPANEVMVRLPADDFIVGFITDLKHSNEPHQPQEIQIAIDGGQADRRLSLHPSTNLFESHVTMPLTDRIHDDLPLERHAIPLLVNHLAVVKRGMSHPAFLLVIANILNCIILLQFSMSVAPPLGIQGTVGAAWNET